MFWQNGELKNPVSGKLLERDSAHSFSDGTANGRFPVIDEIPFLRIGREKLKNEALCALDSGDEQAALTLLLQDRDDWATGEPPTKRDLQPLFENKETTLRGAMQRLRYGAVADYFAYRWSDPTFLSGLALLDWHLPDSQSQISNLKSQIVFELCCGIGHYLREMLLRGIAAIGADVVFSKLWLARKFVAPEAKLICFDANFDFPFADKSFDRAFCHDAFYFLPEKRHVVAELKRATRSAILIGHAHNREVDNFSGGAAISVEEYAELFDDPILYDDAELTDSIIENRHPQAQSTENLHASAAIAIVEEMQMRASENHSYDFALPISNRNLQLNPLLAGDDQQILPAPRYPSERYRDEYAELSKYLNLEGETISFAERAKMFYGDWRSDEKLTKFVRRRIYIDLPEKW